MTNYFLGSVKGSPMSLWTSEYHQSIVILGLNSLRFLPPPLCFSFDWEVYSAGTCKPYMGITMEKCLRLHFDAFLPIRLETQWWIDDQPLNQPWSTMKFLGTLFPDKPLMIWVSGTGIRAGTELCGWDFWFQRLKCDSCTQADPSYWK